MGPDWASRTRPLKNIRMVSDYGTLMLQYKPLALLLPEGQVIFLLFFVCYLYRFFVEAKYVLNLFWG